MTKPIEPVESAGDGDSDLRALYAKGARPSDGAHIEDATWERLASGELTPAEHQRAIDHIAGCPLCGGIYRGLGMLHREASSFDADVPAIEHRAEVGEHESVARLRPLHGVLAAALAASLVLALWGVSLSNANRRLSDSLAQAENKSRSIQASLDERQTQSERERAAFGSTLKELAQPELNLPIVDLDPRSRVRGDRTTATTIDIPAAARTIALVLGTSGRASYPSYAVDITDAQGQVTWSGEGLQKTRFETFTLGVPRSALPENDVRIRVFGVRDGRRDLIEEYSARFRFR